MKILLDTADTTTIKAMLPYYPITGVTTNPSILAKTGDNAPDIMKELKEIGAQDKEIYIQVTAHSAKDIVRQAKDLSEFFGDCLYVKIPITAEGLKAVEECASLGIKTAVTSIFTAPQALVAALKGTSYVIPYVDRIDNIAGDGVGVIADIVNIFDTYNLPTEVLAASFKNVEQVLGVARAGAHGATISCELYEKLIFHPYTDKSVLDFDTDWQRAFGDKHINDLVK